MKQVVAFVLLLLATNWCLSQATPSSSEKSAMGHGSFPVKVDKTLDSAKLKAGDTVQFETIGAFKLPDGTLVPKGSKVTGQVTTAKARSKGDSESQLALSFDQLSVQEGRQLALKGSLQAVFPQPDEVDPGMPVTSGMQKGAGTGTMPDASYKPGDMKSGVEDSRSSGAVLDPKAVGVHGISNLQLDDGVLRSNGKNIKLGGGIRLVVRADFLK